MDMLNVKVNGIAVQVPKGSTMLDAAHAAGVKVPTLCYLRKINEISACRICMVEVVGPRGNSLAPACSQPVKEGMEILTNSPKALAARKRTLQLILSDHNKKCLSCVRNGKCELQDLCHEMGLEDEDRFKGASHNPPLDKSATHMIRDNSKCILCRRCIAVCNQQAVGVIGANNRGFKTQVGCAFQRGLGETSCIGCGQCIAVCPTGALYEKSAADEIRAEIANPEKVVVVQTAPAVRAALGEEFGLPIGTDVEGKMVAALRRLGFDKVFDTDFGADLTIMEEANELLQRVKTGGVLKLTKFWVDTNANTKPYQKGVVLLDGGTLVARMNHANFLGDSAAHWDGISVRAGAGGARFDTAGFNISVLKPILSGAERDGGVAKFGAGTLTLQGANTYNGPTQVSGGTLVIQKSYVGGDLDFPAAGLAAKDRSTPFVTIPALPAGRKVRVSSVTAAATAAMQGVKTVATFAEPLASVPELVVERAEGENVPVAPWTLSLADGGKTLRIAYARGTVLILR